MEVSSRKAIEKVSNCLLKRKAICSAESTVIYLDIVAILALWKAGGGR